jgi:FAD/FMN-containing dehydrogenase
MARMTRDLIDAVLAVGGNCYLPCQPHATVDQFLRAYPRSLDFLKVKRAADPRGRLRNALWDSYLHKALMQ